MKKTISLFFALVIALCLSACGNSAGSNDNGQNTEPGELEAFATPNIATFKAIVVSYEDFDGNRWDNPYYDIWTELYSDKKLQ